MNSTGMPGQDVEPCLDREPIGGRQDHRSQAAPLRDLETEAAGRDIGEAGLHDGSTAGGVPEKRLPLHGHC